MSYSNGANSTGRTCLRNGFEAKLNELTRQCCLGRLYVREWRVLVTCLAQYPALRTVDSTLFDVMRTALPGQAIMVLARLVDQRPDVASVHWLLNFADQNKDVFPHRQETLKPGVVEDRRKLEELTEKTQNLKRLRDKYHAHFDKKWFASSDKLHAEYPFRPDDADALYQTIGDILNRYWRHLRNSGEHMEWPFGKKTDWLLGFLSKSLEAANTHQQAELQRVLNELYHITEKGLAIRQQEHPQPLARRPRADGCAGA